ncbi:MAG: nucleotidyltransferase family protein [Thermocladium sp.]
MINGIILAAGLSLRFPGKLMKELWGKPILYRVIDAFLGSSIDRVVVVTNEAYFPLLKELSSIEVLINEYPERGMLESVKLGLTKSIDADAVVLTPGDYPLISSKDIDLLIDNYIDGHDLVALAYQGRIGHPLLIGRSLFDEVLELRDDEGGLKHLLSVHKPFIVESSNPGILIDIDTEADLAQLLGMNINS